MKNLDAEYGSLIRRIQQSRTGKLHTLWREDLVLLFDYCYNQLAEVINYDGVGYVLNPEYHIGDVIYFTRDAAYFTWAIRWVEEMGYAVTELQGLSEVIKLAVIREGYAFDSIKDIIRELDLSSSKLKDLNKTLRRLREKG